MFSMDDVAKSGIVVLPCGAGKTLVGIAACCRVGRRALVLTTTAVAVDQWRRQLQLYTTLPPVRWQLKRISGDFTNKNGGKVVHSSYKSDCNPSNPLITTT
jgi:DNA excision repair protein ERCC-3